MYKKTIEDAVHKFKVYFVRVDSKGIALSRFYVIKNKIKTPCFSRYVQHA